MVKASTKQKSPATKINIPLYTSLESAVGVALMLSARSIEHKNKTINELEKRFLPSISNRQFKIFRTPNNRPIAFISWAKISDEVEKKILDNGSSIEASEWSSGSNIYIMDIIAPKGIGLKAIESLQKSDFKNKKVKIIKKDGGKNTATNLVDLLKSATK